MIRRNPVYRPATKTTARYRVLYGGAGSGKSVFIAQDELEHAASEGQRVLVLRKVYRTCRHSTFQLFVDIITALGRTHMVRFNKSEMRFDFPGGGAILHAGLDDPEKLKSITGIDRIWIEEATELTKQDFQLVDLRLRGESEHRKQITLSFNPVRSWIKSYLIERTDDDSPHAEDVYHQLTTYRDNPFLDEDYGRILESLPDDLQAIYARGEWGAAVKGLIYTFEITDEECEPDYYGLDFGYNAPSSLVAVQDLDPIARCDELLYRSGLTNSDLIAELETIITDKALRIYCDAAEPARIEELQRAGFNAVPADKSVKDGIDTVKRRTLQFTRTSQNMINEGAEYRWDEERKTGELIDRPLKRNDHTMDALRYAIHTEHATADNTWGLWGA